MLQVLLYVTIISSITAVLAAIIIVVERFVNDYGECDIVINENEEEKLTVQGGNSLLETLIQNGVFIPSACGGRGTCGECRLKVPQGGGPLLPTEEPYIENDARAAHVRLACQVKVRENMHVKIPEELLSLQEYNCVCERITDLTHDIKEFRFRLQDPAAISYKPGQYVQLFSPAYDDNEEVYRAYSIASDPAEKDIVDLVIRLVPGGICTTYCFNHLQENAVAKFNGPYGEFHLRDTNAPCLFIAGGSGMAPMKCILHDMKNRGIDRKVTFFFGANRVSEIFYTDLMRQFEQDLPNFEYVPTIASPEEDANWQGETGLVTQALERRIQDAAQYEAYLCGSPGMIDATIKVLEASGVRHENIFYDKF